MSNRSNAASGIFYGWTVVWAILVILTVVSGLSFYNHSVILDALARNPEFSVESASWAVSLFFVSGGLTGLWLGRLLQRSDPRWCITIGALLSAVALTSLAWVDTLLELYAAYTVFGAGFSASGLLPCTTLVARWFQRRRAVALSIASTGLSLGGVVVTPLCAALVNRVGLETAAPYMGLAYLAGVIPVTWLFLRPSPEQLGMGVDGDTAVKSDAAARQSLGMPYSKAMRHRFFWGVSFAFVFLMMAQVGGISHQFGLVNEVIGTQRAAMALAILPVASIIGRLVGGWILNYVSIWSFSLVMMVFQVSALLLLSLASGQVALFGGLALFGASVGNLLMLQSLLVAEAFGLRDYARIFSIANLMTSLGTAVGPGVLGLVYAMQNSYSLPYGLAAGAGLMGLLCFLMAGPLSALRSTSTKSVTAQD